MTILVREQSVNVTENCHFGDSGPPEEAHTDDIGRLFKSLRAEYGRASKVYIDHRDGSVHHVGWTFTKRMKYENARTDTPADYYIRDVWVTLFEPCALDAPGAVSTKYANGDVTHHPFRKLDIDVYRKAHRRPAKVAA